MHTVSIIICMHAGIIKLIELLSEINMHTIKSCNNINFSIKWCVEINAKHINRIVNEINI